MQYLKEFYIGRDKGPFSSFDQYYHFGASFDDIIQDIKNIAPDLLGISSLFSPYFEEVLTIAKMVKADINIPIILGGHHATCSPEIMLQDGNIDFIIRGEGEKALNEFLSEFLNNQNWNNVQNLSYIADNNIIHNPLKPNYNIEDIPFPDFSDFSLSHYHIKNDPICFILSSRGCPYKCDFCSIHSLHNYNFNMRSADQILKEMVLRYDQGYRIFNFEDDNLTFSKKNAFSLFSKIKTTFKDKNIKLTAMNGISYLHLDKDILTLMKQAGFKELNLALVSINNDLNKKNKRPHNQNKFLEIVSIAQDLNFKITAYQIIGHPEDTTKSMIETLSLLASLPVLIGSSIFYLIKGTGIEKRFPIISKEEIKLGRLTSIYQKDYPFTQSDIFTLFITTRIINFIKNNFIIPFSEILKLKKQEPRIQIGIQQLNHIINDHKHFIYGKNGKQEVKNFNANLCIKILKRTQSL